MKKRSSRAHKSHWAAMGKSVLLSNLSDEGKRRLSRRLIMSIGAFTILWIGFFDSHSLIKRFSWYQEHAALQAENEALVAEIERLEGEVEKGLSDEVVEQIAREHYGMRRPGENVYRVKAND